MDSATPPHAVSRVLPAIDGGNLDIQISIALSKPKRAVAPCEKENTHYIKWSVNKDGVGRA